MATFPVRNGTFALPQNIPIATLLLTLTATVAPASVTVNNPDGSTFLTYSFDVPGTVNVSLGGLEGLQQGNYTVVVTGAVTGTINVASKN